jgi:hypothetical protein
VETESDNTRYYSVDLNLSEAFRFRVPTTESLGELREVLARLPVRRFRGGGATRDTMANTTSCGSLDEVMTRLTALLVEDYQANVAEIGEFCEFEVATVESDLQPDALHVITRIWSKDGTGGEIIYGLRLQRLASESYALWSAD